jgi:hypothetical protein
MVKLRRRQLFIREILAWADAHREATGRWPNRASGSVRATKFECWSQIDNALRNGLRGLPGGVIGDAVCRNDLPVWRLRLTNKSRWIFLSKNHIPGLCLFFAFPLLFFLLSIPFNSGLGQDLVLPTDRSSNPVADRETARAAAVFRAP